MAGVDFLFWTDSCSNFFFMHLLLYLWNIRQIFINNFRFAPNNFYQIFIKTHQTRMQVKNIKSNAIDQRWEHWLSVLVANRPAKTFREKNWSAVSKRFGNGQACSTVYIGILRWVYFIVLCSLSLSLSLILGKSRMVMTLLLFPRMM